ncbi:MAG: 2,3-bisphosphoglycerate-independent phosphoglycerate mutase [Dehalogenimonas sp.]|jgi:2,3-bisphosphoglycerate-independent phosphoglycerate mutase|uniref:2,3-bisphosphoglycerate-independent phosphoglycerate mutase n=1 Tax=Candidatus Dehalogenimonas loeffleri TaxID=3127115 RepID=A0ABZ2J6M0_9CHLR|nr:2,3-bisphosphoglycerate-independent phosphoglycerate mutase [Dehalogenimonas sp.]
MKDQLSLLQTLSVETDSKIVMLVLDGIGGIPHPDTGLTELETAATPNLDALAAISICGMSDPVMPGITPGSAPGHLGLFGYDPLEYYIGRGVLEALGIDFELRDGDVAARGNFCTLDENGIIVDRRAGRISTGKSTALAEQLCGIDVEGVEVIVKAVKDHRIIVVFRGEGLTDKITDSDPQRVGFRPQTVERLAVDGSKMAEAANQFIEKALHVLKNHHPANGLVLRGFSQKPDLPGFSEIYKLKACAIASYPMYRGLAKVVGMDIIRTGQTVQDEIQSLVENYRKYNYFFVHYKPTDATGEDGKFERKVAMIEELDRVIPQIQALGPDVLVVTGDHSTPAVMKGHSWHSVPVMICGAFCRPDNVNSFNERACLYGGLGHLTASQIMPVAMANAMKLEKYGA